MGWIRIGAAAMFLVVGLGAFGAHVLEDTLDAERMEIFRTAVRYHAWHGLGLLAVGVLAAGPRDGTRSIRWAGILLVTGIVLFSGSLYALAWTGVRWLGAITPLGGVVWMIGWILLAMGAASVSRGLRDPRETAPQ